MRAAPLDSNILTITDELLPASGPDQTSRPTTPVEFATPADLTTLNDAGQIDFRTQYPTLDFKEVKAFLFEQDTRRWIGSEASAIEGYRLGSLDSAAPPLPGWARSFGRHASWKPGVPATVGKETPYLNRAQAVGFPADPDSGADTGEFLFRAQLQIDSDRPISFALLHFAVSGEIIELRLNDRPVLLGTGESRLPGVADVSRVLNPGTNILAFHVRNRGASFKGAPSLAFSLEYALGKHERNPGSTLYDQAVLRTRNGDRIRGKILTFNPVSILLQTPYGRYGTDWERVESIVFPQGWYDPPAEKSPPVRRLIRFFGFEEIVREDETPSAPPYGVRSSPWPALSDGAILLRDGRVVAEELIGVEDDQVILRRHDDGEKIRVARDAVAAIYPPSPQNLRLERPSPEFAPLDCRLKTTRGEVFSGILRQIDSRRIVLEHAGDGILSFPSGRVVWIWFPLHRDDGNDLASTIAAGAPPPFKAGASVAILGLPSTSDPLDAETLELHQEIQQAAFLSRLACEYPAAESMINPAGLNPRDYPVVAVADFEGTYPDTVIEEGDARAAILNYVNTGGTLLVYSRRGALRRPRRLPSGDPAGTEGLESPLLRALELRRHEPGDGGRSSLRAFDYPPNLPVALQMKRRGPMPQGLRSLPPQVEAPDLATGAPFYPLLSETGQDETLYQLVNETGVAYGPALLAVRRGAGRILIVDHLLWHASVEGQPFSQVILPQLLSWAFRIQP